MPSTFVVSTRSGNLNVRSGPGTNYKTIGSLARGTRVTVVEFRGKWRKLNTGGWVHADYLTAASTPPIPSGAAQLPSWPRLWKEYPNYISHKSPKVKKEIGGKVDAAWITNTCAIRLSRTLNYNGITVPSKYPGLNTVSGADGLRYAFRVRELRKWLLQKIGKPGFEIQKKAGDPFDPKSISSMKGIIGFDIRFSDATGHLDLWNGQYFSSERAGSAKDYWKKATRIWIWKAATGS